ncbi:serine/threonine-protein kinase PknB [Abditibacteriota bacterium]|nr:serine/threonine-protein kinase PknB [Abditibacteriota bacterium]
MSRQPPVSRVGEYHVLDFVGAGGMGEVFRAVHSRSGRVAAVKFLNLGAEMSPDARARWRNRFIHEARVQESLRHPNLAAFYEWHEIGQTPCIVMELVDGYTLTDRLQQGAMPWADALSVFRQIVEAVAFMHSSGVIHRDLKSGNVKINGRGEVKLLDFGIAKTNDMTRMTATGAFVGTLQYLSPEQVRGKEADARCDIWALGALFYEMLSGSPPFEAPTWGELLEKVTRAHFEPLGTRCTNLPRELDAIVRRCLQKQPTARFADGTELLAVLRQLEQKGISGAASGLSGKLNTTSKTPFLLIGGMGVLVLATWLLWPSTPSGPGGTSLGETPGPVNNAAIVIPTTKDISDNPSDRPFSNSGDSGAGTITIDVSGGSDQTQVFRDKKLIGNPPCILTGRLDQKIEIEVSRPGYETRLQEYTFTKNNQRTTFTLYKQ